MERENLLTHENAIQESYIKKITEMLGSIRYGSVTVTVQDGKIQQIERNEKLRIK